ncbi:MAG TPA: SDR family NAD(P)-dependent oxidoreductase [Candidatus Hydrogenedentes bacterium]|nr:SDR family NAD(P)-dependent oxidoreductase [Candidatus Hydrogenedentota bacterium]
MARSFDGMTAFITGASSGIGAAVARELARQGAQVAIAARRADRLEAVKVAIEAEGGVALAVVCDVRDRASLDAAVARTVETFGGIDVALANAGFYVDGVVNALATDDYRRQFETNVFGVIDTVYAVLPHLEASKGRLGIIGSVMGRMAMPAASAYCASKFAVVGFTEAVYYDLAIKGVSVTIINPGLVASEIRSVNNQGVYTGKPDPAPARFVMPADKAARRIARALYRRRPELVLTNAARLALFMNRHFPRTLRFAVRIASRGRIRRRAERARRRDAPEPPAR